MRRPLRLPASRHWLQRFQFALTQRPPMSSWQIAQAQMTDTNPNELFDLEPQFVEHAADLPVDSLTQDYPYPRHPDRLHFLHSRPLPVEHHAGQQLRCERRIPGAIERHFVFLLYFVARMRQALREVAVVREDEESFGLRVEPPNIEKTRELRRQKIENRIARIGIGARGNEAGRFVQDDVELVLTVDKLAADFDVIAFGRLDAEVGADASVDCDAPAGNQFVTMPSGTDTGGCEKTV